MNRVIFHKIGDFVEKDRRLVIFHPLKDLRKTIDLKDNLFLDRYAQSVTLNGEEINSENSTDEGYGVWRLTRADFEKILNGRRTKSSRQGSTVRPRTQVCLRWSLFLEGPGY